MRVSSNELFSTLKNFVQRRHLAYQNTLPDHSWIKLYVNIRKIGQKGCSKVELTQGA